MSKALVIIDIQKDYFPGGQMEVVGSENATQMAKSLLEIFRNGKENMGVDLLIPRNSAINSMSKG